MSHRKRLVVLPSLQAVVESDGRVIVTQKFVDGMNEYAKQWHGPVTAVIEPTTELSDNLDNVAVVPAVLDFGLEVMSFRDKRLASIVAESAVVLGGTDYRQNHLAALCRNSATPFVVTTEYTLKTRRQIIAAEGSNALVRWRRNWWERSQEAANRRSVRSATGVQCNGLPTYLEYRELNEDAMLYFDTRTTYEMLPDQERLERRLAHLMSGEPLRLVFSGRLIGMKGADHLPRFAAELRRLGVPFTLDICGAGNLEDDLRAQVNKLDLYAQVRFRGCLDFKTRLMPLLQDEIDLFICPHRQGDPSCTYLETLACGVPIVGYANEAWSGLLNLSGCGRQVDLDDYKLLASSTARLHADRDTLAKLALKAWDFAQDHTFEATFARRIEHLRDCADVASETCLAGATC
ncbi:MAG: glycosyltransferase [Planctomycetia bacterium]|nr:glycosyltransferase [Planctomycetia bacterium]